MTTNNLYQFIPSSGPNYQGAAAGLMALSNMFANVQQANQQNNLMQMQLAQQNQQFGLEMAARQEQAAHQRRMEERQLRLDAMNMSLKEKEIEFNMRQAEANTALQVAQLRIESKVKEQELRTLARQEKEAVDRMKAKELFAGKFADISAYGSQNDAASTSRAWKVIKEIDSDPEATRLLAHLDRSDPGVATGLQNMNAIRQMAATKLPYDARSGEKVELSLIDIEAGLGASFGSPEFQNAAGALQQIAAARGSSSPEEVLNFGLDHGFLKPKNTGQVINNVMKVHTALRGETKAARSAALKASRQVGQLDRIIEYMQTPEAIAAAPDKTLHMADINRLNQLREYAASSEYDGVGPVDSSAGHQVVHAPAVDQASKLALAQNLVVGEEAPGNIATGAALGTTWAVSSLVNLLGFDLGTSARNITAGEAVRLGADGKLERVSSRQGAGAGEMRSLTPWGDTAKEIWADLMNPKVSANAFLLKWKKQILASGIDPTQVKNIEQLAYGQAKLLNAGKLPPGSARRQLVDSGLTDIQTGVGSFTILMQSVGGVDPKFFDETSYYNPGVVYRLQQDIYGGAASVPAQDQGTGASTASAAPSNPFSE